MYPSKDLLALTLPSLAFKAPMACAASVAQSAGRGGNDPTGTAMGGQVSGLSLPGLERINNGADAVTLTEGDSIFVWPTRVFAGAGYDATVKKQPGGLLCTGALVLGNAQADVTNVQVGCVAPASGPCARRHAYAPADFDRSYPNARWTAKWPRGQGPWVTVGHRGQQLRRQPRAFRNAGQLANRRSACGPTPRHVLSDD